MPGKDPVPAGAGIPEETASALGYAGQRSKVLSLQDPLQQFRKPLRSAGKTGNLHCGDALGRLGVIIGFAAVGNGQQSDDRDACAFQFF